HDHVVVRLRHARVARVENDVYVIGALMTDLQVAERLLSVHVLEWDHVDGAHQVALVVVGEKRPRGQRGGIDIQRAETGDEIGKGDERADLLVGTAGRRLLLGRRGVRGCDEHPNTEHASEGAKGETVHAWISLCMSSSCDCVALRAHSYGGTPGATMKRSYRVERRASCARMPLADVGLKR